MALNFPASPTEGQIYAAEGKQYQFRTNRWILNKTGSVVISDTAPTNPTHGELWFSSGEDVGMFVYFVDEFSVGQWVQSNGGDVPVDSADPQVIATTDIVAPIANASSYAVVGDVLIQWGILDAAATGLGNAHPVTMPVAYTNSTDYTVILGIQSSASRFATWLASTTQIFNIYRYSDAGADSGEDVGWTAIGKAPISLILSKQVESITGTTLMSYHDPAGLASWRIVGTTLEEWGKIPTSNTGVFTQTFTKTFNVVPTVTVSADNLTSPRMCNTTTITVDDFGVRTYDEAGLETRTPAVAWHAIGEWDGIS